MAGESKKKVGAELHFPPYDLEDLKRINVFGEPHAAEAFVLLWTAIVRTDEKAASTSDLDLWIDVRRKLRALEHVVKETVPDPQSGKPTEVESIVCTPDGGTLSLTARELGMVQRLWSAYRSKMPLAQAERRAAVDAVVYGAKRAVEVVP